MSRAVIVSFYIMGFMMSLSMMHTINFCYEHGQDGSGECPNENGVGHPFMPLNIAPLFSYKLRDAENQIINVSDTGSYNGSLKGVIEYKPAPQGLSDVFGFFSFVITGGRLLINMFFMPLFGFPTFLQQLFIPVFVTIPVGVILFVIQIVGLYEFLTGREIFRK